jgi:hypothetical protein
LPSAIRVPAISYAYCLVPYAYDQKPELSDLQWLSLLRDLSNSTFYSPNFTRNSFISSNTNQTLSISQIANLPTSNSYEFSSVIIQIRSSIFHKFITYHSNQSQIQRFITTHYMLSHKTHQTMINPPYLS